MYMIEITDKKVNKLSEHIEESLRHMGKAMQCVDAWMQEEGMGQRNGYGNRGGYGSRYGGGSSMGYRGEEEWEEEDDEMFGERRGRRRRDSRGRYM